MTSDPMLTLAEKLSAGWQKYTAFFGEPPHGTKKQMAALLEVSGGMRMLTEVLSGAGEKMR